MTGSFAVAILGAVLARRLWAAAMKNILHTAFLIILLTFLFGSRLLPESITFSVIDRFSTRRGLMHLAWQASGVMFAIP